MFETFARSWKIVKISFDIMKKDKELIIYPVLAGIFSLIFIVAMLFPTIITGFMSSADGATGAVFGLMNYIILFIVYMGLAFIATFFNVCVVYTVKTRLNGGNAGLKDSFMFAMSKIHLIFLWSIVSATVGLIMKLLDDLAERAGGIGGLLISVVQKMLGMAWSILTIFVVPSMVYHNLGPFGAIKKSVETLKKTWGEQLIKTAGVGVIQIAVIVTCVIVFGVLGFLAVMMGSFMALLVVIGLAVMVMVPILLLLGVAETIYDTALFQYAETGKMPEGYSDDVIKGAFEAKKR